jgi:hypothetical protein
MDARVGRFAGMDLRDGNKVVPISKNAYIYGWASPVDLTDPSGLDPDLVSISVSVTISTINSTLAGVSYLAQALAIVCTAEELASGIGADPLSASPCHDKGIPVYHGSVDNYKDILSGGLDPARLPTWVSRDEAAAQDAIDNSLDTDPNNSGVVESDIPSTLFQIEFAPFEIPYTGFYPYKLNSTQIVLSSPAQVLTFNANIVR